MQTQIIVFLCITKENKMRMVGGWKSVPLWLTCVCVYRCAAAYVLLAEEEATTITEAERLFKKALSIGKNGFEYTLSIRPLYSGRKIPVNWFMSNYTHF